MADVVSSQAIVEARRKVDFRCVAENERGGGSSEILCLVVYKVTVALSEWEPKSIHLLQKLKQSCRQWWCSVICRRRTVACSRSVCHVMNVL
ncbi:hypothetical protein CEXT_307781 [Caerostris extrusa]|uniref:Uncharacterized protein n=1 Tax=Caerostris extrusa TaxID=172846 RepID=A0AAV4UA67_CAEEX|nr:hypothetical protein CEXT_307781 [Caerostris extrusa]